MQRWTAIFLVLLRLAIGWHFLFEGVQKLHSHYVGTTVASRPFSSAGYFREAPGPLGGVFRATTGDPDDEALARLVPVPRADDADPANDRKHTRVPPGLARDWKALIDRYAAHYGIDRDKAGPLYEQHAAVAVGWLEYEPDPILREVIDRFGKVESVDTTLLNEKEGAAYAAFLANTTDQTINFPTGDVRRRMTMAERIADYRAKLADVRDRTHRKAWLFGRDVDGPALRAAKATVARLRTGLLDDLDKEQTASFIQALNALALGPAGDALGRVASVLTGIDDAAKKSPALKQVSATLNAELRPATDAVRMPTTPVDVKAMEAPLKSAAASLLKARATLLASVKPDVPAAEKEALEAQAKSLEKEAQALTATAGELSVKGPLPPAPPDWRITWMDFLTRWGLTVIGACLLAGFLTRLNCWLGALFLLMTYLAVPPWPWLPAVGPAEGNYVFINKNVVEMLALCVLGTLPTGQWFGADGLLTGLWRGLTGAREEEVKQ